MNGYIEELRKNYLDINNKLKSFSENEEGKYQLMRVEEVEYRLAHFANQVEMLAENVSSMEEVIKRHVQDRSREKNNFQNIVYAGLRKRIFIVIE